MRDALLDQLAVTLGALILTLLPASAAYPQTVGNNGGNLVQTGSCPFQGEN